jgi:hypothetical protein
LNFPRLMMDETNWCIESDEYLLTKFLLKN